MSKKLTIEYVRNEIEKAGYELLSDEYINSVTKLKVKCDRGHEYSVLFPNFKKGKRCPYCAGRRRTIVDIKRLVSGLAPGYECLSDTYINTKLRLLFRCDKGHEYKASWNSFHNGRRCPVCANNRPFTIDYIRKETKILAPGYTCLSKNYVNSSTKLQFRCDKGHIYYAAWYHFKTGTRCPECFGTRKLTIGHIKEKVIECGYICLSNTYKNANERLQFMCPYGHRYDTPWTTFQSGHRCPICSGRYKTLIDVRRIIQENSDDYKCLNRIYKNSSTKLFIRCAKGHIYKTDLSHFTRGQRCPICAGKQLLSIEYVKEAVSAVGYECLSTEYINSVTTLRFRCDKGHEYRGTWGNFYSGCRCRVCMYKSRVVHDDISAKNWNSYKKYVIRLSNRNFSIYHNIINPNKFLRSLEGYHLDHIYTISDGFNNNILPQIVASPVNLQMLTAFNNRSKKDRSDMTENELFQKYDQFMEELTNAN